MHRAGTGDLFGARYQAMDKSRLRELRDWLPLFVDEPLQFEPGAEQRYSNAGYLLLGLVIEKVTGRSYHDAVREMVFVPAGMEDSAPYPSDLEDPLVARGYVDDGTIRRNVATLPWRGSSAGWRRCILTLPSASGSGRPISRGSSWRSRPSSRWASPATF